MHTLTDAQLLSLIATSETIAVKIPRNPAQRMLVKLAREKLAEATRELDRRTA
jgi:hypothetical protein